MADIEVSAVIDKSDIAGLGRLKGSSNAGPVKVVGQEFPVGTLRFVGFRGTTTPQDLKKYHGVFCFDHASDNDHANRKHFDFLKPKTASAKKAKPAKGEIS